MKSRGQGSKGWRHRQMPLTHSHDQGFKDGGNSVFAAPTSPLTSSLYGQINGSCPFHHHIPISHEIPLQSYRKLSNGRGCGGEGEREVPISNVVGQSAKSSSTRGKRHHARSKLEQDPTESSTRSEYTRSAMAVKGREREVAY
uniref:Uncharacterized protein n=1 Tax=Salix viminalis TaxID=40686 RepID=A0A6N2MDT7_SALVM